MLRAGTTSICRIAVLGALVLTSAAASAQAQLRLTLEDAMARARRDTPAARVLSALEAEAGARVDQARAGHFPRVDFTESVERGNQPVFVFGTLLSQRRFSPLDFDIQRLNEPAPMTNVRTAATITQQVFDGGQTRLGVQTAELTRDLAASRRAGGAQDLALDAARVFLRVLQLESSERAAAAAVAAAESDLERARARRDSGLVTEADVLDVEVHLAEVRERQIAAFGDLASARIELSDAVGLPLDAAVTLVLPAPSPPSPDVATLARDAVTARPDRQQADLRVRLADTARQAARAAFFPRVTAQGGWEINGPGWTDQRSAWLVGAQVDVNLFNGFADRARLAEAKQAHARAEAERERIERRIEVEVRTATARVSAAQARAVAGRAAVAQAIEAQRIIRDRYDAGLATITDVLRAAEAVMNAESRATAAAMDVILETVTLDHATGRL